MPPLDHSEDRREQDRRQSHPDHDLELRVASVERAMQRLEQEQSHMKEMIALRFDGMSKDHRLTFDRVELIHDELQRWMADPDETPSGRALVARIVLLEGNSTRQQKELDALQTTADRLDGALGLAKSLGIGSILASGTALVVAILKLLKVF